MTGEELRRKGKATRDRPLRDGPDLLQGFGMLLTEAVFGGISTRPRSPARAATRSGRG
jgi:hypothetical protein